jgi:hypothetical protein
MRLSIKVSRDKNRACTLKIPWWLKAKLPYLNCDDDRRTNGSSLIASWHLCQFSSMTKQHGLRRSAADGQCKLLHTHACATCTSPSIG